MATNWSVKDAYKAIKDGNKEAIQDIGRRFPNFLYAVAANDTEALMSAVPEHITARKMESILKGDDIETTDENVENTTEVVEEKVEPKKEKKAKKPRKKKEEVVEEEEADDTPDPVELYKKCKKAGLKVKARQAADYYLKELAKLEEADDEDDDWGDEEEEAPAPKKVPKKKASKKQPDPEPEDEEDDDDDWDI